MGKCASSRNATRHGLNVPLRTGEDLDRVRAIADLLECECPRGLAEAIAQCILDHERNEAVQLTQLRALLGAWQPPPAGRALEEATRLVFPEYDMMIVELEYDTIRGVTVSRRELAQARNDQRRMRQLVLRDHVRLSERALSDARRSLRYLRRSSNQLVKAVRSAFTVSP
jgi:hypothetical protein